MLIYRNAEEVHGQRKFGNLRVNGILIALQTIKIVCKAQSCKSETQHNPVRQAHFIWETQECYFV